MVNVEKRLDLVWMLVPALVGVTQIFAGRPWVAAGALCLASLTTFVVVAEWWVDRRLARDDPDHSSAEAQVPFPPREGRIVANVVALSCIPIVVLYLLAHAAPLDALSVLLLAVVFAVDLRDEQARRRYRLAKHGGAGR